MAFPESFENEIRRRLGAQSDEFFTALQGQSPVSVRFNPFKLSEKPEGAQVPWSRYGFYLDERPSFTLDPLFHGGAYYVQEASSMFIEHLVRESVGEPAGMRVLDVCAAPGGKTTLLSTLVGLEGLVVANEVIRNRAQVLADNVKKWGLGNVLVTSNDPEHLGEFKHHFDIVTIDAPCSGEGMFRKDPAAVEQWSEGNVTLCAGRQKRILADVWDALKPGGVLIYSTCTFNAAENEENIAWLVENYDCEGVEVDVTAAWGVDAGEVSGIGTYRFWPHRVRGEGFFAAVVRKGDGKLKKKAPRPRRVLFADLSKQEFAGVGPWVGQPEFMKMARAGDNIYAYYKPSFDDMRALAEGLSVVYSGVLMGQLFHGKLKPEHPLALFHDLNAQQIACVDVDLDTARQYLRKADIDPLFLAEGLNLVTYSGLPIGWIRRIGRRANNLYPKELRIANL